MSKRIAYEKIDKIFISDLYRLCKVLNCTPNDLMEYEPGKESKGHVLYGLVQEDVNLNINKKIRGLPLDKIGDVERFLDEMGRNN